MKASPPLAVLLTWDREAPHLWGGDPRAPGAAPGGSVSRRPCSGGARGRVLSGGGVPGPGGIVLLVGVALGGTGRGLALSSLRGPPAPRPAAPVPVQVSTTSSSWSQLCCPQAPAGQALSEASVPLQPTSSSQMGPVPGP